MQDGRLAKGLHTKLLVLFNPLTDLPCGLAYSWLVRTCSGGCLYPD